MDSLTTPSLPTRSQSEVVQSITVREDEEDRPDSSPESAPSRIEGNDIEDGDDESDEEEDVSSSVLEDALYTADEEPYWKEGISLYTQALSVPYAHLRHRPGCPDISGESLDSPKALTYCGCQQVHRGNSLQRQV